MRIVSLLPSATEIVCGLGLRDQLVGVTHECDYPASVTVLPKVTQTLIPTDASSEEIDRLVRERLADQRALYALDLPILAAVRPELIVTQALCDVCAVAESEVQSALATLTPVPEVINLEPRCLADVLHGIARVGRAAHCQPQADHYLSELTRRIEAVKTRANLLRHRPRVMLLEWIDPPFCSGHWNPELVELAGGTEVIGSPGEPSRRIDWEQVVRAAPEVLIIACCGFSVDRTREDLSILYHYPGWRDLPCVRSRRVYLVDGSAYFSRPGPRLVDSLELLAHAIDPGVHPLPSGLQLAQV